MEVLQAQVQELRDKVFGLEQAFTHFLSGEAARLTILSELMHTASRSDSPMPGFSGEVSSYAAESFSQQQSPLQAYENHRDFQNSKLEVDIWKSTVASQMEVLEKDVSDMKDFLRTSNSKTGEGAAIREISGKSTEEATFGEISASDTVPGVAPHRNQATVSIDTAAALQHRNSAHEEVEEEFYKLTNSVYDSAILLFSNVLYAEDSLMLLFGLGVSITIQVTMLVLVTSAGLIDNPQFTADAELWRREHAHMPDFMIMYQNVSLAHAVCSLDSSIPLASSQVEFLTDLRIYTEPFLDTQVPHGLSMIMMVLACWICCILPEIVSGIKMMMAIWSIPHGPGGKLLLKSSPRGDNDFVIRIQYVPGARITFLMLLCLVRVISGCYLCGIGCGWLAQTISLNELLLNAVSLQFIANVDELIYSFLATNEVKWTVKHMASLGTPSFLNLRKRCKHVVFPLFTIGSGVYLWFFFMFVYAVPILNSLNDADEAFCGGSTDFVVWKDVNSSLYSWRPTSPRPQMFSRDPMHVAR